MSQILIWMENQITFALTRNTKSYKEMRITETNHALAIRPNLVLIVIRLCLLLGLAAVGMGCSSDKDPVSPSISKQDEVKARLVAVTWKIKSVSVDGVDHTDLFQNLAVKFTSSGFNATNGGPVWPTTGTWAFTNTDANSITRNDGLVVTIQELTQVNLKVSFLWTKTTLGPGREESVSGMNVFSFTN